MDEQAPTTTAPLEKPLTVLVADDHPLWRDALARDLADHGIDVVGTAGDGPAAVARTRATRPEVLLLDLNLPEMRGDEVTRELGDVPTRVLILSASGEESDVLSAVKAGAQGYLVKSASSEQILEAVHATARGEAVFTPGLAGLVLGEFRQMKKEQAATSNAHPVPELTPREVEILRHVATGMGSKEIAALLFISHRTVQNHVQNILGKLHLHNRVELTRFAMERGIEPPA
ncbi:response regulator [Janibacter massiliensis]|uniref:response regulator n=1 Tax=Janibacter massiliensis TaxID=2058291 RepID=UPI000D0F6A65|nr:response regulator transcription factor [Janibacter massiliensis]